eukprot:6208566-Pleurochrysis_carterae.AAC.1
MSPPTTRCRCFAFKRFVTAPHRAGRRHQLERFVKHHHQEHHGDHSQDGVVAERQSSPRD